MPKPKSPVAPPTITEYETEAYIKEMTTAEFGDSLVAVLDTMESSIPSPIVEGSSRHGRESKRMVPESPFDPNTHALAHELLESMPEKSAIPEGAPLVLTRGELHVELDEILVFPW